MKKSTRIFVGAVAALMLVIMVVSSVQVFAAPSPADAATAALGFYKTQLKSRFELGESDPERITANTWHAACLKAGGVIGDSEYQFMTPSYDPNALTDKTSSSAYATTILGMKLLGQDPAAVVEKLVARQAKDGSFPASEGSAFITDNIWSVVALDALSGSYDAQKAVEKIIAEQTADGGFAYSGDKGSVDLTGMALLALAKHRDIAACDAAVAKAIDFLKKSIQDDGFMLGGDEWASKNACSQAYGIIGLVAAGETVDSAVVNALLSCQQENGGFLYDLNGTMPAPDDMSTQQAVMALDAVANSAPVWYRLNNTVAPEPDSSSVVSVESDASSVTATDDAVSTASLTTDNRDAQVLSPATGDTGIPVFVWVILGLAIVLIVALIVLQATSKKKGGGNGDNNGNDANGPRQQ